MQDVGAPFFAIDVDSAGRVLSSTPATMHVLPSIVKALRDRGYTMPILVDGGVRDGGMCSKL
ncbi:alpha-hydroxy-acid oxidizing protein [Shewanella metallivivens]|uniref:alpha-hydroxy-acid oxidizing protein n=1 Tax=Shewanella metallivivens TaxID=2872342 RepID=UPI0034A516E1